MSQINLAKDVPHKRRFAVRKDIEISKQQIMKGRIKDARTALQEMRARYGLL